MVAAIYNKHRDSNLELFRVIVMLLIIAHHYVVNSGVWSVIRANEPSANTLFFYILGMWGKTGINCFVLISGWFMCSSKITLRKFLKLLLEIEFYKIGISLVFLLLGKETISTEWFFSLLPIRNIQSGFVSCFLVFWLLIPFMNILVNNMSRRQHALLIVILLFIYTFLGTIPVFTVTMNYVSWFCTLYFIASFLRLYDYKYKENNKAWLFLSILSIVISVSSVIGIVYSGRNIHPYWFMSDSNKIMALLCSICFFNYFRTLAIPYCKIINVFGASTFGVLLIHAHSDTMRSWLWSDLFDNIGHITTPHYVLRALCIVLLVFVVCATMDYLRIRLLERPLLSYYDKKK